MCQPGRLLLWMGHTSSTRKSINAYGIAITTGRAVILLVQTNTCAWPVSSEITNNVHSNGITIASRVQLSLPKGEPLTFVEKALESCCQVNFEPKYTFCLSRFMHDFFFQLNTTGNFASYTCYLYECFNTVLEINRNQISLFSLMSDRKVEKKKRTNRKRF